MNEGTRRCYAGSGGPRGHEEAPKFEATVEMIQALLKTLAPKIKR